MQYYATIILYSIVQGFSSSSEDSADDMRIFFENDNIFDSLMHLMAVDPPENRTLQLPARHIREIRALLCGVYGTLFERAVVNDYGAKFPVIRSLVRVGFLDEVCLPVAALGLELIAVFSSKLRGGSNCLTGNCGLLRRICLKSCVQKFLCWNNVAPV